MKGEAICDGKPTAASSWGRIGGRESQTLGGEHRNGTRPIARSLPGPHSGAERLPNFLDDDAITVVNETPSDLRRQDRHSAPMGNGLGSEIKRATKPPAVCASCPLSVRLTAGRHRPYCPGRAEWRSQSHPPPILGKDKERLLRRIRIVGNLIGPT